jgi:hypothetical protein
LEALEKRELPTAVSEAVALLATIIGQDLVTDPDGTYRIVRKVAKDRIISTVDSEARHGHKTSARSFDGFKGHVAIDPDSEIITQTTVTPANAGDASVAEELLNDVFSPPDSTIEAARPDDIESKTESELGDESKTETKIIVFGDAAYGTGEFLNRLDEQKITSRCKTQFPTAPGGLFSKSRFEINLEQGTVTCPDGATAKIYPTGDRWRASFRKACRDCPLQAQCTTATRGRSVNIGPHERILQQARREQQNPVWQDEYRSNRSKVERKIGHLMRNRHGGRRARMRGSTKVDDDFRLLAAARNIARFAVLGIRSCNGSWTLKAA